MIPVFQTIIDKDRGNCMQAVVASLFDKELKAVPNFINYKNGYFKPLYNFIKKNKCEYDGMLWNKNYTTLNSPTNQCFREQKWSKHSVITPKRLYRELGINGLFYAGVLSPKYFKWSQQTTHAVIIDRDFNIVHDPNPGYRDIMAYPLADILGYNGVVDVYLINK